MISIARGEVEAYKAIEAHEHAHGDGVQNADVEDVDARLPLGGEDDAGEYE